MNTLFQSLFYLLFVRLIIKVALGLNIRNEERLPIKGPAIIVANHRSRWDNLILASLLPEALVPSIKFFSTPKYFLEHPLTTWFSQTLIGIQALQPMQDQHSQNPLQPCFEALANENIILLYTDEPLAEQAETSDFKTNLTNLAKAFPTVPIIPVDLRGLGNELPKDKTLFTSYFCDVFIGQPVFSSDDLQVFDQKLEDSVKQLNGETKIAGW